MGHYAPLSVKQYGVRPLATLSAQDIQTYRLAKCDIGHERQTTGTGPVVAAGAANSGSVCGVCAQLDSD